MEDAEPGAPCAPTRAFWGWLSALLAASVGLRGWLATRVELAPDEAYYWSWSTTPRLSWLDHPPLTAWLLWLTGAPAGSELGVRWLAIAASSLAVVFFALGARRLAGERGALGVTTLMALTPAMAVASVLLTPDAGLLMCWTGASAAAVAAASTPQRRWPLVAVAAAVAAGLLFKLTMVLWLGVAALAWALGAFGGGGGRRVGIAAAAGVAAAAPIYAVGLSRGHILDFQLGRLHEAGLRPLGPLEAAGGWLGLASPVLGLAALVLLATEIPRLERRSGAERVAWAATAVPLNVFVLLSLLVRVEPNWLLPALPGAGWMLALWAGRSARGRAGVGVAAAVAALISGAAVIQIALSPVHIDPARDPLTRVRGWRGWAEDVRQAAARQGCPDPVVITARYQEAAELRFYGDLDAWPASAVDGPVHGRRPTAYDDHFEAGNLEGRCAAHLSERPGGVAVPRPGQRLWLRVGLEASGAGDMMDR